VRWTRQAHWIQDSTVVSIFVVCVQQIRSGLDGIIKKGSSNQ